MPESKKGSRVAATLAAVLAAGGPAVAAAQHHGHHEAEESAAVGLSLGLGFDVARFELGDSSGRVAAMRTSIDLALPYGLAVGAVLPVGHVMYDDGPDATGVGDLALGLRGSVWRAERGLDLALGLTGTIPTGDADLGLGMGHVMLMPFVEVTAPLTPRLSVTTHLMEHIALGGDHDGHGADPGHHHGGHEPVIAHQAVPGCVLSPASAHEAMGHLGVSYRIGALTLGGQAAATVIWEGDERLGPVTVGALVGWEITERLGLSLGSQVEVAGQQRLPWQASTGLRWRL